MFYLNIYSKSLQKLERGIIKTKLKKKKKNHFTWARYLNLILHNIIWPNAKKKNKQNMLKIALAPKH